MGTRRKRFYDYTPKQARIALQLMNTSQTEIAKEFGVSPQAVYQAINQPSRMPRIADRIEELIAAANEIVSIESLRKAS